MGNSQTKETRSPTQAEYAEDSMSARTRSSRMSRGDLGFLNIGTTAAQRDRNRQRDDAPFEHRETRAEREARRLERERATRAKVRERSLREEHVDGGYLVTLGTYTGTEDFNKPVVRQLQIERRIAPFWRGLNDWSDNWAEHQLIAAARGLPVPAADATPDPDLIPQPVAPASNLQNLTVPMGPRTLSAASDRSGSGPASGVASPSSGSKLASSVKPRAKALAAALTGASRDSSAADLTHNEIALPVDPFVNGQPLEVHLYKDAADCPICFLSYPPYLNRTRCCDQPICTECFVQIKRADPHLPEHHPDGEVRDPNQGLNPEDPPEMLISEPSACPYCQQPEFGVTYEAPPFRRGLIYSTSSISVGSSTPMSSQSSLHSTISPQQMQPGRKRGHSLSANAPNVITTDRIRPDWSTKLMSARAHQARRAAAATALHTAAFLVGSGDQRSILRSGRFGRRGTTGSGSEGALTPSRSTVALGEEPAAGDEEQGADGSRRTRMDELEDMMFMEAVRLSLAAEEERKRKEAKAYRKEAKKREQAEKKALKKQGKDPYGGLSGASGSSLSLGLGRKRGNSGASNLRVEAAVQNAVQVSGESAAESSSLRTDANDDKGKGVDREAPASTLPIPSPTGRGTSHLRQISNASSLGSSPADTPAGSYNAGGFHPDGTKSVGMSDDSDRENADESMFNFRSLAEVVGVDIDHGCVADGSNTNGNQDSTTRPLSRVSEDEKESELQFPVDEPEAAAATTTVVKDPKLTAGQESQKANPTIHLPNEETLTESSPEVAGMTKLDDVVDKVPEAEQKAQVAE